MAIYHLSARPPIARASGRTATAAAAYRAGARICDVRTGLTFDYRRKRGVIDARIQLPSGTVVSDRAAFWNSVEQHHRRRDAVVAREVVVALPIELSAADRAQLALDFASQIADEYGVGVDCSLHEPSHVGDDRNYHAHLMITACNVGADGSFGRKVERLDPIACKRSDVPDSVSWLRPRWEYLVNAALARGGWTQRVDHRSHKARGIALHPSIHVGRKAAAIRIRGARNAKLKQMNAAAVALEDQIQRLVRLRARLTARNAALPFEEIGSVGQDATPLRKLPVSETKRRISAMRNDEHEALLLPWKRRRDAMPLASDEGGSDLGSSASGRTRAPVRKSGVRRGA